MSMLWRCQWSVDHHGPSMRSMMLVLHNTTQNATTNSLPLQFSLWHRFWPATLFVISHLAKHKKEGQTTERRWWDLHFLESFYNHLNGIWTFWRKDSAQRDIFRGKCGVGDARVSEKIKARHLIRENKKNIGWINMEQKQESCSKKASKLHPWPG